jgi:hypothetical protein
MFEEQFNVPKTRNENINEIELVAPRGTTRPDLLVPLDGVFRVAA